MLPYVEVANLAPSASFYSAITHPLGLRYISANPGAIVYGAPSPTDPNTTNPVFEVRSVGDRAEPRKHARLVLSAPSHAVVQDFRAAALRAYPDLLLIGGAEDPSHRHSDADPASGDCQAQIRDLDGNIMEVVYLPPGDYPSNRGGSTVRRTQNTCDEVSRILNWNQDVAVSHPSKSVVAGSAGGARTAVARRPGSAAGEGEPYVLRRSVTTSVIESAPAPAPAPSPRENSNGLSTNAIVGTVLGAVAAGAAIGGALTYMNMKGQRERAPRQEFDAPAFQRRATFPEPYPDHKPRYVERTVEKVYYADQLPPAKSRHYPPPTYMAKYSQVGGRSREVEELDDRSSRYTARQSTAGKSRTRSEAGSERRPMMIADAEYRSNAGSKYTTAPKMLMDTEHRSHAGSRHSTNLLPEADQWSYATSKHTVPRSVRHHEPEVETYISSRSKHHEPEAQSYISSRSKHHEPEGGSYISSRSKHHPPEAETYISSRSKSHAPETYVSSRSKRSERSDRSESTIRPARQSVVYETPRSVVYGDLPIRGILPSEISQKVPSVAPSRHTAARSSATAKMGPVMSTAGSRATARMVPLPGSHASYASARDVPLPGSRANWDDDNDSIAPSDSISCIGTRR
ncbi:hypothetical protein SCAR479_10613 [Seiridium cardinale]|uniref:Uncharacterized protein n=1 Tax=Seiridium cardinale TaxID=138064 RepID=A0ABR2XG04_9PEZI